MAWITTPEAYRQATEEADDYLRGNGIGLLQRKYISSSLDKLFNCYREAFGSAEFRISWKKLRGSIFVELDAKCGRLAPPLPVETVPERIAPPVWQHQFGVNTVSFRLEAMSIDMESIRFLFGYMGDGRRNFYRAVIFRFATMSLAVAEPLITAAIITALSYSQIEKILLFSAVLLACTILSSFFTYFASKMLRESYSSMLRNMRMDLTRNVLKINTVCMDEAGSGTFTQRLINETDNCADSLDELLGELTEIFRLVSLLISFGIISTKIMLYEMVLFIVYVLIQRAQTLNILNDNRRVRAADETQHGLVGEMVRGHRDIKLLHCEESFLGRLNQSITSTLDLILQMRVKSMRFILIRTQFNGWSNFLFILLLAAILAQGTLEAATLLVLFNYNSNMTGGCARSVSDIMNTLYQLSLSTERIYQIMNSPDYAKESFGKVSLPAVSGELEFRDVGFSYSHEGELLNVLSHLNLKIHAGEAVAFVGRSGCGKSTILSLITRLYDPQEGEILLDGVPLKELSQDTLRGNMTMVSQSPYIFNMSVRDNLRVVRADLTDEEMYRVCRIACIHEDVLAFPQGYDTVLGEGGVTLSGGQKQRLALARSILRNDPVLLLDEATSALDNETQAKIHGAISSLRGRSTLIMVAHRLSTVINCDRLFLIRDGRVAAEGTHEQLLQNCEDYRRLYTSETGKEAENA